MDEMKLLDEDTRMAIAFAVTYKGDFPFMLRMQKQAELLEWQPDSDTVRKILNCKRFAEKNNIPGSTLKPDGNVAAPYAAPYSSATTSSQREPGHEYECYKCHWWYPSMRAVLAHKPHCTGTRPPTVSPANAAANAIVQSAGIHQPTISPDNFGWGWNTHPHVRGMDIKKRIDFSAVQDGRYAIPKGNDWIFVHVTTENRKWKGHRFIKWMQSDNRRIIGQQRPGETEMSVGRFEEAMFILSVTSEQAARQYARLKHHCPRCGKELTDEHSREMMIGPDCAPLWGWPY
jgi:predicted RNA-binding Zn-ribbon protein involved in translation (DUF1610 family)